jgi:hypothetical protein
MIEAICNEILDNYTKKEDQLMTDVFGNRQKQSLNRVMDAPGFNYTDYLKIEEEAGGGKKEENCEYYEEIGYEVSGRRQKEEDSFEKTKKC